MSSVGLDDVPSKLPDYDRPPVSEVVLGVQFLPIRLRAIDLAPLRELWDSSYPTIEEHPPLDPAIDSPELARGPRVTFGPAPMMRYWWISGDGRRLIQVQSDRFLVNWRRDQAEDEYPRYPAIRASFDTHFEQFRTFAEGIHGSALTLTQCEVTYVNDLTLAGPLPEDLSAVVRFWADPQGHHLGRPLQAQAAQVFDIPAHPGAARMYVGYNGILRPDGTPSQALTLTVRGAPPDGHPSSALPFLDAARAHIVTSFRELCSDPMNQRWGLHDDS